MKKIVFTGGGTGGHIMPNLSLIKNLQDKYKIYYFGSNGMEKDILKNYPRVTFVEIPTVKFVRSLTPKNLMIPFKLASSIKATKRKLKEISPNLIFSKGGFVSIPVCLAGQKLKIPTITHESDITMGLANKIIAKNAKVVCCSFETTANKYGKNAIYLGSPIRPQIYLGKKENVLNKYNLTTNKPIILITGGSLGAQAINNIIWDNLTALTQKFTLIHLVGKGKTNKQFKNSSSYVQIEFVPNIEDYFAVADLVVSRAGSNTIFELLALKKLMLLIPLSKKSSRGDQILNAKDFKSKGFCEYILEENLSPSTLASTITQMLKNKNNYISKINTAPSPDGTKNIIATIEKHML